MEVVCEVVFKNKPKQQQKIKAALLLFNYSILLVFLSYFLMLSPGIYGLSTVIVLFFPFSVWAAVPKNYTFLHHVTCHCLWCRGYIYIYIYILLFFLSVSSSSQYSIHLLHTIYNFYGGRICVCIYIYIYNILYWYLCWRSDYIYIYIYSEA